MTRRMARLGAGAALGLILASGMLGAMVAEAQPIRIRKAEPAPAPTPEPTPQSGEIKNLDVTPPPPLVGIKIGGGGQSSSEDKPASPAAKPASPAAKPAAKPPESKDSVGDPAEIFKWVLTQPLQPQTFSWQAGAPPTLMPKVETHICLLTEVSGKFQGAGEKVHLAVDKGASGGARYVLRGDGASGYVRAVATCAGREKFVPIADKQGTGVADERSLRLFSNCQSEMQLTQKNNILARAPFLTTVSGKFQGEGESLAADVGGESGAVQRGIGCSGHVAGAITLHGNMIWPVVRYRTQTSRTTNLKEATFVAAFKAPSTSAIEEFFAGTKFSAGAAPIWMVPVDEALCGLTMMAGKFQGYGEAAQIRAVKNSDGQMWWQLAVTNQTNGGTVLAGARCIARDQRGSFFTG